MSESAIVVMIQLLFNMSDEEQESLMLDMMRMGFPTLRNLFFIKNESNEWKELIVRIPSVRKVREMVFTALRIAVKVSG